MPEERFTVTEAAAELRISRQTLYNWLGKEPELRRQLDRDHTLSRRQLDYLLLQQQKKPVKVTRYDLQDVDAALTERMEALEARVAALEEEKARARMPSSAPRPLADVSLDTPRPQNRTTAPNRASSKWPSVSEYAESLGVNARTARDQAHDGLIDSTQDGPRIRRLSPAQQEAARKFWGK